MVLQPQDDIDPAEFLHHVVVYPHLLNDCRDEDDSDDDSANEGGDDSQNTPLNHSVSSPRFCVHAAEKPSAITRSYPQ